jgi:hypothetical protein
VAQDYAIEVGSLVGEHLDYRRSLHATFIHVDIDRCACYGRCSSRGTEDASLAISDGRTRTDLTDDPRLYVCAVDALREVSYQEGGYLVVVEAL